MDDSPDKPASTPFDEASEVPERALRIYARLWQFETWLRRMVYVELRALLGDDWSKSIKPNDKAFNSDKYLKHMPTPEMNALSYAPLSQLTRLLAVFRALSAAAAALECQADGDRSDPSPHRPFPGRACRRLSEAPPVPARR
ncbi:hypothetical protein [Mesorhizobium temperatum]|uniref:Uncharacterized protein n=1 Tax=Mesorhizobium temperatum TaxID=241416 RepID=A0A271LEQ7_9HYPH|nr:hypothetical protein [Mesorhizobium temperatum]PAQ06584.1 hypothetical protein CIT26_26035 [Mesorhizobium temperatum]